MRSTPSLKSVLKVLLTEEAERVVGGGGGRRRPNIQSFRDTKEEPLILIHRETADDTGSLLPVMSTVAVYWKCNNY